LHVREVRVDLVVEAAEEVDGVDVLLPAIAIGNPLALFP
jgi:hypothetical protein